MAQNGPPEMKARPQRNGDTILRRGNAYSIRELDGLRTFLKEWNRSDIVSSEWVKWVEDA